MENKAGPSGVGKGSFRGGKAGGQSGLPLQIGPRASGSTSVQSTSVRKRLPINTLGRGGRAKRSLYRIKSVIYDAAYFEQGNKLRVDSRLFLDQLIADGTLSELESGVVDTLACPMYPRFIATIQYGMLCTFDAETQKEVYHCIFQKCMKAPLRLKTTCEEHSRLIVGGISNLKPTFSTPLAKPTGVDSEVDNIFGTSVQSKDSPEKIQSSPTVESMELGVASSGSDEMASKSESGTLNVCSEEVDSLPSSGDSCELMNFRPDSNEEFPDIFTQVP